MWSVSVIGGSVRQLRENVVEAIPSPDGLRIAFRPAEKPDEIWISGVGGENARTIGGPPDDYSRSDLQWSPDGQRLAYIKRRSARIAAPPESRSRGMTDLASSGWTAPADAAIEILSVAGGQTGVILSDPRLEFFCWARDGIFYVSHEPAPNQESSNLWELRVDPQSAKPIGGPRRIANWLDYTFDSLPTISADGTRLALSRGQWSTDIWWGALEGGGARLSDVRRLTPDERYDWPGGWTRESDAALFYSDRNGSFNVFRQSLDASAAEQMTTGSDEARAPQLSPDGSWVLYLSWPPLPAEERNDAGRTPLTGRLIRIRASGGPSETVFEVAGRPGRPIVESASVSAGLPAFRCPQLATASCVVAERQGGVAVFTAFDPVRGRTGEVARFDLTAADSMFWDLSPDGSWIAAGRAGTSGGARIRFLPLRGGATREIVLNGFSRCDSVAWSADGKTLFATAHSIRGGSLLHVTANGDVQVLRKSSKWLDRPIPSPDGRHLLFADSNAPNNLWVLQHFR